MTSNTITLQVGGALELILRPPAQVGDVIVRVKYGSFIATAKGLHMAYTMPTQHYIEVQVAYQDAAGNAAVVDGTVTWASSDDTVAHVDVNQTDSTMCKVTTLGPLGTAQVTATADADLGEGVRELITTLDITVVAGEAVAGTINVVGTPQPVGP